MDNTPTTLVVTYPPAFDGELHVSVTTLETGPSTKSYKYDFTHAAAGDSWNTLVEAARAILNNDLRRRRSG